MKSRVMESTSPLERKGEEAEADTDLIFSFVFLQEYRLQH